MTAASTRGPHAYRLDVRSDAAPSVRSLVRRALRLQALLMVAVALTIVAALASYQRASVAARDAGDQLVSLEALRSEVVNAETGLRGYALVRRDEFRTPYDEAFPLIDAILEDLRDGLPGERSSLDEIDRLMQEWRTAFATRVLTALEAGDEDTAEALFETGAGRRRIDRIQAIALELIAEVQADAEVRNDAAGVRGVVAVVAVVAGTALALLLGERLRRRLERRVVAPIGELAAAAARFGSGDLSARSSASGTQEVEALSAAFDDMADRLSETVTDLRAVDKLKSQFVSVVSHELRTPLTSIRGSLGLLASGAMGEIPADAEGMLTIAVNNTDRLVRLINEILDLERMESGAETLELTRCEAMDLMTDAAANVSGNAEAAGVTVTVEPFEAAIDVDADRIVRALTNLLGNAVKFSDRDAAVVLRGRASDDEVVFEVVDRGRGIPADQLDRVFERFAQVDASDARDKRGTGLGLAIVDGIARQHGGRVEVTSTVGVGSTFALVLPRTSDPLALGASSDAGDGRPLIVLAEDDESLCQVMAARLGQHDLEVLTASTVPATVALCLERRPAVLVLDIRLSDGDGYDVVRTLRADDRARTLPTVVFTVLDLSRAERDRLRLGPTSFVTKGAAAADRLDSAVLELLDR